MSKGITSTEGFLRKVYKLTPAADEQLFYRGHSDRDAYTLHPSLLRKPNLEEREHFLFRELILSHPGEFAGDTTTLEKLVRMQHHSLPTRLLDITSNPLVALFFACRGSKTGKTGEVVVFRIKEAEVKYFDSDTASCIASLSRLSKTDKDAIDWALDDVGFNSSPPIERLLHFIKEEKPYFRPLIKKEDLKKVICIKSKLNNQRILVQSGSFLLFGIAQALDAAPAPGITIERLAIKDTEKPKILAELDKLNINESTLFPGIENAAKYIGAKYGA